MLRECGELCASTLGCSLVVAVQHYRVAALTTLTQPGCGDGVVGQSIFVFESRGHEEGKVHSPGIHLVCESCSEIACLISDSGYRHDQFSGHTDDNAA